VKRSKHFFFEKKKQKTFLTLVPGPFDVSDQRAPDRMGRALAKPITSPAPAASQTCRMKRLDKTHAISAIL
jgi:hypothetical protein